MKKNNQEITKTKNYSQIKDISNELGLLK